MIDIKLWEIYLTITYVKLKQVGCMVLELHGHK